MYYRLNVVENLGMKGTISFSLPFSAKEQSYRTASFELIVAGTDPKSGNKKKTKPSAPLTHSLESRVRLASSYRSEETDFTHSSMRAISGLGHLFEQTFPSVLSMGFGWSSVDQIRLRFVSVTKIIWESVQIVLRIN
jgi:hypothetical protein